MSETSAPAAPDPPPSSPLAVTPPPQRRRGCLRRVLILGCGTLLCFCLLVLLIFYQMVKTDIDVIDLTSDESERASLVQQGWPASLHRIFRARNVINFNGDGFIVNIHSFDPKDVPTVQSLIGPGRTWLLSYSHYCIPGMHAFKDLLPADLYFDDTSPKDHYIYLKEARESQTFHVIDTVRGIHYEFIIRT